MLNLIEHNIETAYKNKILKTKAFLAFKLADDVPIMLINVKMPTVVGISAFMSMIKSMLR